jgi:hypothetical protein
LKIKFNSNWTNDALEDAYANAIFIQHGIEKSFSQFLIKDRIKRVSIMESKILLKIEPFETQIRNIPPIKINENEVLELLK